MGPERQGSTTAKQGLSEMSAKPLADARSRDKATVIRVPGPPTPWEQTTVQIDVTLALLLRMIRRRKWLLIFTAVIVPLLSFVATQNMTPRYTATADIVLEPQQLNIADVQSILTQTSVGGDVIASEIEILSSRALAAPVIERLRLFQLPEFNPALRMPGLKYRLMELAYDASERWLGLSLRPSTAGAAPANPVPVIDNAAIIGEFLNSLEVEVLGQSRVIQISYASEDPRLAAEIVNALVDVYLVNQLEAKFDALKRASSWLNERLETLREQALQSENAVEDYRATAGLTQGVQASLVTEQISRLNAELDVARAALAAAQAKLDQARALAGSPALLASLPEVLNYPGFQRLVQEEALLQQQIADMATRVGERHPELVNLRARAATISQQVAQEIQRVIRSMEPEVASARATVDDREAELAKLREDLIAYNAKEAKLRSLEREAETNQGLLQTFLERAKETTDRFELESADARLLANAIVPSWPSHPNTNSIVAVAAVFGVMLGLLLVYVAEQLNQTIRSGDDIEGVLGLTCLSIVPKLSLSGTMVNPYDYVLNKPMSAYAEAFRSLRAALWLDSHDGRGACKSVAIMSSRPGEGKTATSVSLARVAAAAGERVILVDCDVRQPSVGQAMKAGPGEGLVDILTGKATRAQATRRDAGSGMDYILIGTNTPNSAQLLMSDAMASLVQSLRGEYDLVVLDAPPILALSDARILATVVDAVIYCVLWRETSRGAVMSGLRILRGIGANIVGAVLTQVNLSTHARAGFTDSEFYSRKYSGYYHN